MSGITVVKTAGMGIGGAGIIGATGYGAYSLIQPKNIRDQLIWDKFELLEESSNTWKQLVSKYSDDNANKLNGNLSGTDDDKKAQDLKDKCRKFLDTPLTHTEETDNANITKAKQWCIKEPEALKANQ